MPEQQGKSGMTSFFEAAEAYRPEGEYLLLDSGNERKLERVGSYLIDRPSPQAVWSPLLPPKEWSNADAAYERGSSGGEWEFNDKVARRFNIVYASIHFQIKLTDFGHLGLFPEQASNWEWMRQQIRRRLERTSGRNLNVLNLFAYTGGSTLACSQAGAHVVHVDAAKGVVDWAKENAQFSHLHDRPIRWLIDDALKFVRREERRGNKYQGIILDPPSFGRGPKGEVFKIENDLIPLLQACREILAPDALFFLLSCHTPGFTPVTLYNQVAEVAQGRKGKIESGEMLVYESNSHRALPSGAYARWLAER
jgi:23S rRNA (cytosine1962-C5)-methyltransferase